MTQQRRQRPWRHQLLAGTPGPMRMPPTPQRRRAPPEMPIQVELPLPEPSLAAAAAEAGAATVSTWFQLSLASDMLARGGLWHCQHSKHTCCLSRAAGDSEDGADCCATIHRDD